MDKKRLLELAGITEGIATRVGGEDRRVPAHGTRFTIKGVFDFSRVDAEDMDYEVQEARELFQGFENWINIELEDGAQVRTKVKNVTVEIE